MYSYWFVMEQSLDKLQDAKAIRHTVFVEEQGFRNEFDEIDPIAHHIVVYIENTPVATGRVFAGKGEEYIIGRIAVVRPYRGEGFGRIVVENLENQARVLGAKAVMLSAQTQARGFYESLGYDADGEVYLEEHCPHVKMKKCLQPTISGADSLDNAHYTV
ncbi:MAG: GNAT family N-acetyltransferase [Clostridium sp.]|uniref:GNAT family N-acetyltransferase n=1 Tax=Clostridium sp. TaxID=1506 RepID=UPI0029107A5B|nr:GNAT family N-acetyltransferase [Clostridium sp.]MDU7338848.1 GNAT family N-acetyltransferase [Clostridium sp.]